jgi:Protein of unknown function (DUF1501)
MRRRDFLGSATLPLLGKPQPSCMVLRLTGGPSQLDTWDMKPDAPSEIRGPFRPIRTNVSGIEISEIFPRMSRHADKFSIIRSVHHTATTHAEAGRLFDLPAERVHVRNMFPSVFDGVSWDVHGWKPFSPISAYREVVGPMFDRLFTSILESGVLENTFVVALGEFGRTPKINPDGGRDHWPHCYSVLMAGRGIQGGQIYGSSDRIGAEPRDNPVTPAMITAKIRRTIGLPEMGNDPFSDL